MRDKTLLTTSEDDFHGTWSEGIALIFYLLFHDFLQHAIQCTAIQVRSNLDEAAEGGCGTVGVGERAGMGVRVRC